MEGPYRDLGSGFARLTGQEGVRRSPSRISHVEDALLELLRNARDAGARNVFVATTLTQRRYRTLTVIDDGEGIPPAYTDLIFEPGVTTRHLAPVTEEHAAGHALHHGAGLALYHLRQAAISAEVVRASSPTALKATFDTHLLPERSLQSSSRPSKTNLLATLQAFAQNPAPKTYYGSPPRILATLLVKRIIHPERGARGLRTASEGLGLGVSLRTAQRVVAGRVARAELVEGAGGEERGRKLGGVGERSGALLPIGGEEKAEIAAILGRAARAGYMEVEDVRIEVRPGEISVRARVYEPEDEYE